MGDGKWVILLDKIDKIEIVRNLWTRITWLNSYLFNRTQVVHLGH